LGGSQGSLLSGQVGGQQSLLSGSLLSGQQNLGLGLNAAQTGQVVGASNVGAGLSAGAGNLGSGYRTKQWEKQSKWSSQNSVGFILLIYKTKAYVIALQLMTR